MQEETKEGTVHSEVNPRQTTRKSARTRLTDEQRELEEMQLERLRRQGSDRLWRSR